jgi:hypothetical protein
MSKGLVYMVSLLFISTALYAGEVPMSQETRSCLNCHRGLTPGIVKDWESGRHAVTTPGEALKKEEIRRRMSAEAVAEGLADVIVGCYECHGRNPGKHKDNFSHYGFSINLVVSPNDCAACHPEEAEEYASSKKAHAWGILQNNPVYHTLVKTVIGAKEVAGATVKASEPSEFTRQETCFACHGTELKVKGLKTVRTALGVISVPDLENWPNQGVGRINPDGTRGACTPCHARHAFSIKMARKPYTCSQCHLEPDVPAWNVYKESKHGNIYETHETEWDFTSVPWKLGEDFLAPTCAACHNSLIASPEGKVIAGRTHDFGARLWVRLFGLIYTHPQPIRGDTSIIRNRDGLPLPTTFAGEPASEFLIGADEQKRRKDVLTSVCRGCHSTDWVDMHFAKMDNTIRETDGMTLAATRLLEEAWEHGLADDSNPFDEAIEQKWIAQWLFYGNSVRYASAMTGAQDYTTFKYGWWGLTTNLEEMKEKIETKKKLGPEEKPD